MAIRGRGIKAMLLNKYASEFVSICAFILKNAPNQVCETYQCQALYLEPEKLRRMLDKNKFEECDVKLRAWRNLGWLVCNPERFTKIVKTDGKPRRLAVLNRTAFEQLSELLEIGQAVTNTPMGDMDGDDTTPQNG